MVFHHPPFLFFHFPHQQKRPFSDAQNFHPSAPSSFMLSSSWRHFCSKSNPSFIGTVTTLYSYRGMIHPPNRSSANLHSNSNHPPLEEAGETLRPLLLSELRSTCSKTSHREVLLVSFNRQQAGNFFSYKIHCTTTGEIELCSISCRARQK